MIRLKPMLVVWSASALVVVLYYGVLRQHVFHMEDTHAEVYAAGAFLVVTVVGLVAAFIIRVVTAIMGRPAPAAALSFRVALLTGTLLMLMVVLSQVSAYTPQVAGVRPVSELRSVEVNGRTEWLSIRGQDRTKPVLLFLSGGPGGSHLATARHYFASLENDYVVVVWEQPGAAKSFGAIAPEDLTLDTYLSDGETITAHLRGEFDQDRIYLMGESWGSALGLMMTRQHPEYYRAFVGTGQMVDFLETERIDYQMALDDARRIGDEQLADRLAAQGPPPYTSDVALKTYAYLSPLYGTMARTGQLNDAPFSTMDGFFGVEYGLLDKINFFWGLLRTFDAFYGKLYSVNLRDVAAEQQVPIHIFHGRYDFNAPSSLVEDYYEKLRAPRKTLVYFEHSGHNPWQTENDLFISRVRAAFGEA